MTQYLNPLQNNVETLNQLINEFLNLNNSKSSDNKNYVKQVENNLKILSKQQSFFQLAYQYIMNGNQSSYPQLFIASLLLRDKFRYEFDKYSDQQTIIYLENLLKTIIKKYNNNPPDTFTSNICVCMICLYIKRADQLKQKNGQFSILQYFKSFVGQTDSPDYFYKALMYAPEEIFNSKIVLDEVYRNNVKKILKYCQFQVLKHLNSVAHELWEKKIIKKRHLFSALQNWISIGYKESLFQDLPNHFLVQKLFESCLDSNFSTEACDCLKQIIHKMKVIQKDDTLFAFVGNGIFSLVQLINKTIKSQGATIEVNEAIQVITQFGLIFSSIFIQNYNSDVKKFLESTIQYIKLPDIDVYPKLIDFWQNLTHQIQTSNSLNAQFLEFLKHVYASICYKNIWTFEMMERMNEIPEQSLGNFYNEAQNIMERRENSHDFFETLSVTFGQQNYLDFVLSCITNLDRSKPQIFWPYLQSYLNSLKNALKRLPSVTQSLKMLVKSYNEISMFSSIKNAFMLIFKNLMTIQEPNGQLKSELIKHLFQIIATNLTDKKVQQKAQKAFSKGCEQNPGIVINYIDGFISLLKQHQGNQQIVKGLMYVLSSNPDIMQKYLPNILHVQYQIFSQSSNLQKRRLAYYSIYSLFKIINNIKNRDYFLGNIVQFTNLMWPILINNLKQPKDCVKDEDPQIERTVRLIKYIMRCLRDQFVPFLESLFTTVLQAYQKHPICSYIYTLQVAITVFYNNPLFNDYFKDLYQKFCKITYAHLQNTQQISDYQLLIDDFIGMNKRFFIYNSRIVLESGQLPSLIETCINLTSYFDVPQVSKSAYQFFQTIFMIYWDDQLIKKFNQKQFGDKFQKDPNNFSLYLQLKEFIIPKLSEIIMKMLTHLQKVPLQSIAGCILDCLMSEVKGFPQQNIAIWTPILQKIPQQILTISQKAIIFEQIQIVGFLDDSGSQAAAQTIDRLFYTMNKRFINNEKRKL